MNYNIDTFIIKNNYTINIRKKNGEISLILDPFNILSTSIAANILVINCRRGDITYRIDFSSTIEAKLALEKIDNVINEYKENPPKNIDKDIANYIEDIDTLGVQGAQGYQGIGNVGVQGVQGFQGLGNLGTQGFQGVFGTDGANTLRWIYGDRNNIGEFSSNDSTYIDGINIFYLNPDYLGGNADIWLNNMASIVNNGNPVFFQICEVGTNKYATFQLNSCTRTAYWTINVISINLPTDITLINGKQYSISYVFNGTNGLNGAQGRQGFQGPIGFQGIQGIVDYSTVVQLQNISFGTRPPTTQSGSFSVNGWSNVGLLSITGVGIEGRQIEGFNNLNTSGFLLGTTSSSSVGVCPANSVYFSTVKMPTDVIKSIGIFHDYGVTGFNGITMLYGTLINSTIGSRNFRIGYGTNSPLVDGSESGSIRKVGHHFEGNVGIYNGWFNLPQLSMSLNNTGGSIYFDTLINKIKYYDTTWNVLNISTPNLQQVLNTGNSALDSDIIMTSDSDPSLLLETTLNGANGLIHSKIESSTPTNLENAQIYAGVISTRSTIDNLDSMVRLTTNGGGSEFIISSGDRYFTIDQSNTSTEILSDSDTKQAWYQYLGLSSGFTLLSSDTWDFSSGAKKNIIATSNLNLSIINTLDGDTGLLVFRQDSVGGRNINLPGYTPSTFNISLGPDEVTILGFINQGGDIFWSVENYGSSSSIVEDIIFTTVNNIEQSGSNWIYSSGATGGYGNTGLSSKFLPSNQTGRIICSSTTRAFLGFSTNNMLTGYADMLVGIGVDNSGNIYTTEYPGTLTNRGPIGSYTNLSVQRDGSTGTLTLELSLNNGATWTVMHTFTGTYSNNLYVVTDISGSTNNGHLDSPKSIGLV